MEIEISSYLMRDLKTTAKKKNITINLLIEQILSTAMLVEIYLDSEDVKQISAIYKKYIDKAH